MGINIVIQPFHDFRKWENEGYRTRDAHIFEHLQERDDIDKIIIINRPVPLPEYLLRDVSKKYKKGNLVFSNKGFNIWKINSKVFIFDFYVFDTILPIFNKRKWWDTIFKSSKISNYIKGGLHYLNINEFVLLLQNPLSLGLINNLEYKYFVFDSIDNWLEHEQMFRVKHIIANNYKLVDQYANLIISVSRQNQKLFQQSKNFHEIKNGVDIDQFSITSVLDSKPSNPIIGYVGKIQNRFDFDLLEFLADKNRNFDFHIYGPILSSKDEVNRLKKKYKNIYFMGEVSYIDLPKIMQTFSVGIIPHKVNKFTESMDPLKIYEYLASGIPVITTNVNGVSNLSSFVYMVSSYDDFSEKINYLNESKMSYSHELVRQSLNSNVNWSSKVEKLIEEIQKLDN